MTDNNPIKFTQHAIDRTFQRWIKKDDVERIIRNPIESMYDQVNDKFRCFGKGVDSYTKEEKYLIVVFRKFNTYDLVITAMWATQGDLKVNGFNKI